MPILGHKIQSIRWLLAELFVIVLGITIAFQVEEWRSELSERRSEKAVLESILNDFEVATEQFQIYVDTVTELNNAARELRSYFRNKSPRSEEELVYFIEPLLGAYLWQSTDSTWVSTNPANISNEELRRRLIRFNDGFMPYMLNISETLQLVRAEFLNTVFDDFERNWDIQENFPVISAISPLDKIPTNREFYKKLDNYRLASARLSRRIPEAIQDISEIASMIEMHIATL